MKTTSLLVGILVATGTSNAVQASPRSSAYWELGFATTVHPVLGREWRGLPVAPDFRLGAGLWLRQRVGLFVQTGIMPSITVDELGHPELPVEETLRYLPMRAGAKFNIWPRRDWVQLNLVGSISVLYGIQELRLGTHVQARNEFLSFGIGAGAELNLVKAKAAGISISVSYFVQPTSLPEDMGFRTSGLTDLGGLEIMASLIGFWGAPG